MLSFACATACLPECVLSFLPIVSAAYLPYRLQHCIHACAMQRYPVVAAPHAYTSHLTRSSSRLHADRDTIC